MGFEIGDLRLASDYEDYSKNANHKPGQKGVLARDCRHKRTKLSVINK